MRLTILALVLLVTGCTTPGTNSSKIQPAPPPYRDNKTPVALQKPSISQRIAAQRIQDAQVAQGDVAVEGRLSR